MEGKRGQEAVGDLANGQRRRGHLPVKSLRFSKPQSPCRENQDKNDVACPGGPGVEEHDLWRGVCSSEVLLGPLLLSKAESQGSHWAPRRGARLRPWRLPPAVASAPPPAAQWSVSPQRPSAQRGETNVGHPKKQAGGRLGQATVGTRAPAQPSTTGLPACSLLPEPHPCVRVCADHMVTQTRRPDPRLTHCGPWPEELTTASP